MEPVQENMRTIYRRICGDCVGGCGHIQYFSSSWNGWNINICFKQLFCLKASRTLTTVIYGLYQPSIATVVHRFYVGLLSVIFGPFGTRGKCQN